VRSAKTNLESASSDGNVVVVGSATVLTHLLSKCSDSSEVSKFEPADDDRPRSLLDLALNQLLQHRDGKSPVHVNSLLELGEERGGVDVANVLFIVDGVALL
jgi:hypothetical protein